MSCQENCEAISELSAVCSVTFGVAGSWCLPGALGPNWDCSAVPGELPRLPSFPFTHSLLFPLLSPALSASLAVSSFCASRLSFSPSTPGLNRLSVFRKSYHTRNQTHVNPSSEAVNTLARFHLERGRAVMDLSWALM